MASDSELRAAGYNLPRGDDYIAGGDDAIRQNAAASYDQAIAVKAAAIAYIDGIAENLVTHQELEEARPSKENVTAALGYAFHVGSNPPESPTLGQAQIIWFDTRDPGAWVAAAPTIDDKAKAVIIPEDEGAGYVLNGEEKTPGKYAFYPDGAPIAITVVAKAKPGYTLSGAEKWTGFITAGWRSLGTDPLTSGVFEAARSPFGSPYSSLVGNPTISARGMSNTAHASRSAATQKFPNRTVGMRVSAEYDISNSIGGSQPSITLGLGYRSTWYADTTLFAVGISRTPTGAATMGNGAPTAARDPYTLTHNGAEIPLKGTLVVECVGTDVKIYVGSTLIGTGTAPGAANGMMASISLANNESVAKNFTIEVQ